MNINNFSQNDIRRFWDKVNVLGEDDCWEWQAFKVSIGYGRFRISGANYRAHRISWILANGKEYDEIPKGFLVLHSCDNASCCNPRHLRIGTQQENIADRQKRNRGNWKTGDSHHRTKVSDKDVLEIFLSSKSPESLAKKYGVSVGHIRSIRKRDTRTSVTKNY